MPGINRRPTLSFFRSLFRRAAFSPKSYKLLSQVERFRRFDANERTAVDGGMRDHVVPGPSQRAGDCAWRTSAGGHRRTSGTAFACRLGLATWTLPVEWATVCVGAWILGSAPSASRDLGARAMGSSRRGLGLYQWILALGSSRNETPLATTHSLPGVDAGRARRRNESIGGG
jgi:hypothetical protein